MSFSKDIQYRFSRLYISEKLIIINLLVFVVNNLAVFLFKLRPDYFMRWFELPRAVPDFGLQPWSVVTYSFFHGSFSHLFWNMLLLYVSGRMFMTFFSPRRFLVMYFLGAAFGGFIFMLSYNLFPVFSDAHAALIGASAAVMAILIFVCTYMPNREVRLIFFNVKLWYIGVFLVILDLVQIPMGNSGGHLAHLGGAFIGFFYAGRLREGKSTGRWFEQFMSGTGKSTAKKKKKKKTPLKTVYKNKTSATVTSAKMKKEEYQQQIDDILDKISKSGYESLSKEEKDFLFKAGKE